MPLLYFWRGENYRLDLPEVLDQGTLLLQQNAPLFGGTAHGDRLWAFTRMPRGHYVLAAQLRIDRVEEATTGRYGRFTAYPLAGSVVLYDVEKGADAEPLIRRIGLSAVSEILGQSFQGAAAVRAISVDADQEFEVFAGGVPILDWTDRIERALVLAEQVETIGREHDHWEDITGQQYHFPNKYRHLVETSRPFVYYRGVRRESGRRGAPEYFGCGQIGDIWPDPQNEGRPRRHWRWYWH